MGRALALATAVVLALTGLAWPQAEEPEPYLLIRALQFLQDDIARGSQTAHADQGNLLDQIARSFAKLPPATWRSDKNVEAAAIYLFSGGSPAPIRTLLARVEVSGNQVDLLRGALAQAEGRDSEARKLLLPLDARAQSLSLGGPLALVQAMLVAAKEPDRAVELLDTARLLAPGTIVEETALRREIVMAGASKRLEIFDRLAEQYLRRFPSSIYAGDFRAQLREIIVARAQDGELAVFRRLEAILALMPRPEASAAYFAISRAALMGGRLDVAGAAAEHLATLEPTSSGRAGLYRAAARIFSDSTDATIETVAHIDPAGLSEDDRGLLLALRVVAEEIRAWPDPRREPEIAADHRARATAEMSTSQRALTDKARAAVAGVDEMLLKDLR